MKKMDFKGGDLVKQEPIKSLCDHEWKYADLKIVGTYQHMIYICNKCNGYKKVICHEVKE